MAWRLRCVFSAAILLFLAACASLVPTASPSDRVRTEVAALVENWARAGTEGRWHDVLAAYADDPGFAWVEQGALRYPDRNAIAAALDQVAQSGMRVETRTHDVVVTPIGASVAAVRANVSVRFSVSGSAPAGFDGVLTATAIKRDGRWVFLQGHISEANAERP